MTKEIKADCDALIAALTAIGKNENTRGKLTELLIEIEKTIKSEDKNARETVIGPIMDAMYRNSTGLRKEIEGGLVFNFFYNSKIAREFLLSDVAVPDHVWEPQTTRILQYFSKGKKNVIVGGAFFGDQAVIIANELSKSGGVCHAFEPNSNQCSMLRKNAEDNKLKNLLINQVALWDKSGEKLVFDANSEDEGNWGATDVTANENAKGSVDTVAIDDYCKQHNVASVDLIMLDLEGGEISAIQGAEELLKQDAATAPVIVFEVHSKYTDWKNGFENINIIQLLHKHGYKIFAIRDYHSNRSMKDTKIELIPTDAIYLEGPHHGFNVIAVKDMNTLDATFSFVKNVSPKYLDHRDPAIHQPLN